MSRLAIATPVCLLLLLTGCGSQLSEKEIAARTAGSAQLTTSNGATTGAASDGGTTGTATGSATGSTGSTGSLTTGSTGSSSTTSTGSTGSTGTSGTTGGSGSPATSGAASGTAGTTTGGSGGPDLVVGNVGTVSGVAGVALGPVQRGVAIWVKYVNAHGGVNGRKVVLKVADDNSDSGAYQRYVKQLVEQDHVVAFLANEDANSESTSTLKYLEGKNVPLVGTDTGSTLNYSSRIVFPQASAASGYSTMSVAVWVKQGLSEKKSKFGLVTCQEVAVCNSFYSSWDGLVRKYGGDPVYKGQTSLGAPSFTSECLSAIRAGVQVLVYVGDPNSLTRLASSCRSQGYSGTFAAPSSIVIASQAQDANLQGTYVAANVTPWPLSTTAEQQAFQQAFQRYSGADGQPAGGDMVGWVAGRLFEASLRGVSGPVTGQTVMNGLYSLRKETLNGLTGPLTYNPGKPATPIACGAILFIKGNRFAATGDGRLTCY